MGTVRSDTCVAQRKISDSSGFSLVEILVVMAIVATLFGLSWSAFYGMRTTMRLKQASENFKADLTNAQRSAMFLKRDVGDNWTSGVGIDLGGMMDGDDELTYTMFKWCSSTRTYVDFNGGDFATAAGSYGNCQTDGTTELAALTGHKDILVSTSGMDFKLGINGEEIGNNVQYIIFESVTGIPHFFTPDWIELNVDNSTKVQLVVSLNGRTNGVSVMKTGDLSLIPKVVLVSGGGCTTDCDGKECGSDGCGSSCGFCGDGEVCEDGACVSGGGCTPDCGGKECGDDGCGGSCGSCAPGYVCENQVCEVGGGGGYGGS